MENQPNNLRRRKNNKSNNIVTSFLQAGYSIVPIKKGTKGTIPSEVNYEDYTKKQPTHEEVKAWLEAGYGLSLVLGFNGLVLIDFDDRKLFEDIPPEKVNTTTIKSPQKGGHLLYQGQVGEISKYHKNNKVVIEIKNSGTTPLINRGYKLLNSSIPEEIASWEGLIKELLEKSGFDVLIPEYSRRYSIKEILQGASDGERNNCLFALIHFCKLSGSTEEGTEAIVWNWNKKLGKPLPVKEVRATLKLSRDKKYQLKFQEDPKKHKITRELKLQEKYGVPPGWVVNDEGIFLLKYDKNGKEKQLPICNSPLKISGRGDNIDTEEAFLRLSWKNIGGEEHKGFFPLENLYTKRELMKCLPAKGVEVTDNTAKHLIDFIFESVAFNKEFLEKHIVTEKQGWKTEGFVLGDSLYSFEGGKTDVLLLLKTERLNGLRSKGTLIEWYNITERLLNYQRGRFKVYAACSAPLLRLLDVRSYIIDDYGETSTGKTTTSELAMSVWGNPYKLELSGNATKVGVELLAAAFCDLPLFLDETSLINSKILKEIVYMLANETGRLRGKKTGGLQPTENWKTVVFSTGEASIKDSSSFEGLSGRVIELYGGLGATDLDAIEKFKDNLTENYGVVGELLIKKIISYSKEDILETFKAVRTKLRQEISGSLEARVSNIFAAIATAGLLFEELLEEAGLPDKNPIDVCLEVYKEIAPGLSDTGYLDRFLLNLQSWVVSNRSLFLEKNEKYSEEEEHQTIHERYGRITNDFVDVFPHILKKETESWGFNYNRIIKDMKEKKIILCNNGNQFNTMINGEHVIIIRFFKNKIFLEKNK